MKKANKMLWEGVYGNNFDKVRIALNLRADVNSKDNYDRTPLHTATSNNRLEVSEQLK